MRRAPALVVFALPLAGVLAGAAVQAGELPEDVVVVGDAVVQSLSGAPGDPGRGRDIAFARERGNCPVCHLIPAPDERSHGDVGPSLRGVADRLSEGQLRLRVVDERRLNPSSIMPSYYRRQGLKRVVSTYVGKTVLTAQEVEDVVAFLMTLHQESRP